MIKKLESGEYQIIVSPDTLSDLGAKLNRWPRRVLSEPLLQLFMVGWFCCCLFLVLLYVCWEFFRTRKRR